jgi:hypothetical protein
VIHEVNGHRRATCDGCGVVQPLVGADDARAAEELLIAAAWLIVEDRTYCPPCSASPPQSMRPR